MLVWYLSNFGHKENHWLKNEFEEEEDDDNDQEKEVEQILSEK